MIPVIEDYLSELIDTKMTTLKNNPELVRNIIATTPTKLDSLMTYISKTPIKVVRGYPRTSAELPCVCILLSSDNENQEGLGDYGGDISFSMSEAIEETTQIVDSMVDEENIGRPYFKLSNRPLGTINEVINTTLGITYDPSEYAVYNEAKGMVALYTGNAEDRDSIQVNYNYKLESVDGIQVQFENNFRIEVWTTNADLTVQLYYLIKWALLSGRDDLVVELGLYRQRLSGSDFQPAPSFFPDFVYRRGITFWCQVTVSTPTEEVPYISGIGVNQTIDFDT